MKLCCIILAIYVCACVADVTTNGSEVFEPEQQHALKQTTDDEMAKNATCQNAPGNTTGCPSEAADGTIADDAPKPTWMRIFDACQLACTLIGCVANLVTLFTLIVNHRGFARIILVLLRHQSLVDAWVCAMASMLILQPFMWLTGNYYLDVLICYCWHGQAFYWGGVTLSTFNLMAIALERYLAVCRPFDHGPVSRMSGRTMALLFALLYLVVLAVTHGTYIQTRLDENGQCLNEYAFDGHAINVYFFAFVIFTYIVTYFVPVVFMTLLYGLVIHKLHQRQRETKLGRSRVIDRASAELTKTAITVTVIFIVTIGYDLHYYLLGYTGGAVYELGTPIQKVGVFLSNLNSVANPFVYALLMPMYRRAVQDTFMPVLKCFGVDTNRMRSNGEERTSSSSKASVTEENSVATTEISVVGQSSE